VFGSHAGTSLYTCRVREVSPFVAIMVICQNYVVILRQQCLHFKILTKLVLYFRDSGLFKALRLKLCSEPDSSWRIKKVWITRNILLFVYITKPASSRKNCCLILKVMLDDPFWVLRFCLLSFGLCTLHYDAWYVPEEHPLPVFREENYPSSWLRLVIIQKSVRWITRLFTQCG